jgi:hypothetical protein
MSSSAGRNRSFRRSSRGFAIASPTLMTRYRIAQSGENWNPKSPENRPEPAVSCKNDYSDPAARPPCSTAWRFLHRRRISRDRLEARAAKQPDLL